MSSSRLERDLLAIGEELGFPPTPDLVSSVMTGLPDGSRPLVIAPVPPAPSIRPSSRRWVGALAAVAVVAVLLTVAVPSTRRAVAGMLGLGGVSIELISELPPTATLSQPPGLPTDLVTAATEAPFPLLIIDDLPADEVLIDGRDGTTQVTLLYGSGDAPRLAITQFAGSTDDALLRKRLGPGTEVTTVDIRGLEGRWITGAPHAVDYQTPDGEIRRDQARLAGNTLIFVQDGVTVRIETAGDLDAAREVAGRLVPFASGQVP